MRDRSRVSLIISVLAGCGALAACSRAPVATAHTVGWYLANDADRTSMVERCANDPGTLGKSPDCINAFAAAQRADIGSLRKLPPMGLMDRSKKPDAPPGQPTSQRP